MASKSSITQDEAADVKDRALTHRIQRLLGCEAVWPKGAVDRAPISSGFENNEGQALGVVFLI